MKSALLFQFLVVTQILSAQTFTEKIGTPFEAVDASSIAFADVDGDNDQDVIITGRIGFSAFISKLYTNDGRGNFNEMTGTPFDSVGSSSIAFADVDGDNDQDVLITGQNSSLAQVSKLYTNDGMGNFTEKTGTPFDGVGASSIAFADVDGDNDQDVLITGINNSGTPITKLYTNDGAGNFTEVTGTPFDGVQSSSIAFADVDGDNDQDVLITGENNFSLGTRMSKLYTNDGGGNFTEKTGTPFDSVARSSISFADVDGDNDQDVLITGQKSAFAYISKLYTNDGMGNFTEMAGTPFDGVNLGSIAFADVDGDNDQDVLITGRDSSFAYLSKLYTNDGGGNFTEVTGTPFDGVQLSSIAFADVDSDNDQDVLITGQKGSLTYISKLYTNDGIVSSVEDLKIELSLDFKTFPNPSTSTVLYLRYNASEMGEVTLKVYNLNGVLLRKQREFTIIGQQTFSMNITSLPKGNYFIELNNRKKRGVATFVVQ